MGSELHSMPVESEVSAVYHILLSAWNRRSASDFAALFEKSGVVIGFDGSQMNGPAEIESELERIFRDHATASYLGKVKSVRFLSPEVAIVRAIAGMRQAEEEDINPAVNTIQSLVVVKVEENWRIALYQNTPAQFHDRPDLSAELTEELRRLLKNGNEAGGKA